VRAVTFNIHHGAEGLDRLCAYLRSLRPDVLFLQEVDRGCARSGGVDQAATVAGALGLNFVFGEAFPYDGGSYGLSLLSRWPLTRTKIFRLPHPSPRQHDGRGEPRILLTAETRDLMLAVTHLGLTPRERRAQADRIRRELWLPRQLILGADLNEGPTEAVAASAWRGWLSDAFREGGGIEEATSPADRPRTRIDGLFRTADAPRAREAAVGATGYSDHRAVRVDFDD
jgi:endonuclease/exonuclease/phosphatase family metal-dependent hydrolase